MLVGVEAEIGKARIVPGIVPVVFFMDIGEAAIVPVFLLLEIVMGVAGMVDIGEAGIIPIGFGVENKAGIVPVGFLMDIGEAGIGFMVETGKAGIVPVDEA